MRKIFLTVIVLFFMVTISFASPHENGIDDFYFGQPIEEIQQQYELTDKEFTVEDGAVIYYKAQVPSLNFYGVEISQPITLGFKNNRLYKITFNTDTVSLIEAENQQKMIANFASVQYGNSSFHKNRIEWITDKIFLCMTYNVKDNLAYLSISMNENTTPENISETENTSFSEIKDNPISIIELPKNMNPIQAQLYVLCKVELNASLEDTSNRVHLIRNPMPTQMKNKDIMGYRISLIEQYMYGVDFEDKAELSFYKNYLNNVFLMFTGDGVQLKNYLIENLGTPIAKTVDMDSFSALNYSWINGDYGLSLLLYEGRGNLNFYYIPYQQDVTKISLLEYAEVLKSSPQNMRYLENLIKENPRYKENFKSEMKSIPEYEQALKDAGMDMSIFN